MIKDVYRFYGKKNCMIMNINAERKNGSVEIVPSYDPNRQMRGPVSSGSKVYNYDDKKVFSISSHEALKLLNDFYSLENQSDIKCKGVIHDRSKVQGGQNMLTILTVGKYKTAYTITILYKMGQDNIYESYLFHNEEEYELFKGYLRFVAHMLTPMSVLIESFFDDIYGLNFRQNFKNNRGGNNNV